MNYIFTRTWAEINLDNIAHNVKEIQRVAGKRTEIMAVVKADAYGHGVLETVNTLVESGCSRLAVSMLDEAIQLRQIGIDIPILVLSHTDPSRIDELIKYNITQTVYSHDIAKALSDEAVRQGTKAKVHIKIDTGMARVGFPPGYSAVKAVSEIQKLPGIIIEGIFTHFAVADENDETSKNFTLHQAELFNSIISELNRIGILIPIRHVANSAAIIQYPQYAMEMVRPGIILYGIYPSRQVDRSVLDLKPAMTLKTTIAMVKWVEENTSVSYGRKFITRRKSKIATIPVGYADGYSRLLTGKGRVLVNGQYAPVVGSICMDQCMIDVTDIEGEIKNGNEVVLLGKQGNLEITAEELADHIGTIPYEIVCIIGKRVPRVYSKNGEIVNVLNYLNMKK
ncbi:MAG: alanine racemase [Clostridiaceae bacterium]|nr:alanine racemase [Clostridiaceae bacterium]